MNEQTAQVIRELNEMIRTLNGSIEKLASGHVQLKKRIEKLEYEVRK